MYCGWEGFDDKMKMQNLNKAGKEMWDDRMLSGEDAALSLRIDEFFRAESDIMEVKCDPAYIETDMAAKALISDYQKNTHNPEAEKFISESLAGVKTGDKMVGEIRDIKDEIKRKGVDEITSEWVKEWHIKKQKNGAGIKDIQEFITSSFNEHEVRSGQKPDHARKIIKRRSLIISYISAAAAVITGVIFIIKSVVPSGDTETLFKKYYDPLYAVSPVTRSLNVNETNVWSSAVASYNKGDYQAALKGFSSLVSPDSSFIPPRFFLGMTHVALGNYREARDLLKGVAEKQGEYSKEARWYLGLIYLKDGEEDKASDCFELLAKTPGYYSERADKILRRLK
jgi:TolA-binding protein